MLSPRRKLINLLFYNRNHYNNHHNKLKLFTLSLLLLAICFLFFIASIILFPSRILENKIIIIRGGNEVEYLTKDQKNQGQNSDYSKDYYYYDNVWTRISDSLHVYSAHLDSRNNINANANLSLIRIIGLKRVPSMKSIIRRSPMEWFRLKDETFYGDKYICKVFISSSSMGLKMIQGDILTYTIIEEGVKAFASCYINCYINATKLTEITKESEPDVFVAIYPVNVLNYPDKLIPVEMKMNFESRPRTLGLCIRPLFGPMDDLPKLIQFISYYQKMGVTSMDFYDLSISPRIRKYLNYLRESGEISVSLNRWNLPTGNTSELWDFGSLAALNDCLFRRMRDAHVIFVDIDELIVPQIKRHKSLHDLINFYETTSPNFRQLLIRNAFFCHEFCLPATILNDMKAFNNFSISISTCTIRAKKILNVNMRSKFIVKPRKVISVGHHLVTKFVDKVDHRFDKNSIEVRTDVALLNHYRECESISSKKHPILNRLTVLDTSILRFLNTI